MKLFIGSVFLGLTRFPITKYFVLFVNCSVKPRSSAHASEYTTLKDLICKVNLKSIRTWRHTVGRKTAILTITEHN